MIVLIEDIVEIDFSTQWGHRPYLAPFLLRVCFKHPVLRAEWESTRYKLTAEDELEETFLIIK